MSRRRVSREGGSPWRTEAGVTDLPRQPGRDTEGSRGTRHAPWSDPVPRAPPPRPSRGRCQPTLHAARTRRSALPAAPPLAAPCTNHVASTGPGRAGPRAWLPAEVPSTSGTTSQATSHIEARRCPPNGPLATRGPGTVFPAGSPWPHRGPPQPWSPVHGAGRCLRAHTGMCDAREAPRACPRTTDSLRATPSPRGTACPVAAAPTPGAGRGVRWTPLP